MANKKAHSPTSFRESKEDRAVFAALSKAYPKIKGRTAQVRFLLDYWLTNYTRTGMAMNELAALRPAPEAESEAKG